MTWRALSVRPSLKDIVDAVPDLPIGEPAGKLDGDEKPKPKRVRGPRVKAEPKEPKEPKAESAGARGAGDLGDGESAGAATTTKPKRQRKASSKAAAAEAEGDLGRD